MKVTMPCTPYPAFKSFVRRGGDTPTSSVQGCTSLDKKGEEALFVPFMPLCLCTLCAFASWSAFRLFMSGVVETPQPQGCKGTSFVPSCPINQLVKLPPNIYHPCTKYDGRLYFHFVHHWGVYPISGTGYAVGGTPLAVSRRRTVLLFCANKFLPMSTA